jgi:hypothetical protein
MNSGIHSAPVTIPLQTEICRLKHQRIVYRRGEGVMTHVKEEIINELDDLPPRTYGEVLDFIRFLKSRRRKAVPDTALASEPVLRKDWLRPEEEEAWSAREL